MTTLHDTPAVATALARAVNLNQKLYSVTLPWSDTDPEQGTYSDNVWATSVDAAIRSLAAEMADHPDAEIDSDDDAARQAFIEERVDNGGGCCVVLTVSDALLDDLEQLLRGPQGDLSDGARADLQTVRRIIAKYAH